MKKSIWLLFFSFILSQSDAGGSINNPQRMSLSIPSGVEIEVYGEVEVEFINVEGLVEHKTEMSLFKRLTIEALLLR